ncbi:uncharacterized protein M6B38_277230 [Iris pallida]|uniref:Methyltransferase-like protein 13 n=1 Tax=Iris pallida TaxID=29817 RepID=A0AAX6I3Q1_IRIPA|nr:uncharacterized protein M6B38_277230 [Iris pallida]
MSEQLLPHGAFDRIFPSRFISFTFPNPLPSSPPPRDDDDDSARCDYPSSLRVAVLDSPDPNPSPHPLVAAMLVPVGRHRDWIFSTFPGHLHLLSAPYPLSRLILIGQPESEPELKPYTRNDDPDPIARLQRSLLPLLLALSPKPSFRGAALPQTPPFLSYEDDVAAISPVDLLVGPVAGEMLVEDVRLDTGELRRRLRFKRAPNLVQSQVRLVPDGGGGGGGSGPTELRAEAGSLAQPYLAPMLAGLSLWAPASPSSVPSEVLCVGVGGGALLTCLRRTFGFRVLGVEADETVVRVAKKHFGLAEDEMLRLRVGDGIELIRNGSFLDGFDVVMVDLDFADGLNGVGAPPVEFVEKSVLLGAKSALRPAGILVVNVIMPMDAGFYGRLVGAFGEVFEEVYEIDVGNGENYVLVAVVPSVGLVVNEKQRVFSDKLKQVGAEAYVHCTKRI